jgi:general stress protein 26
MTFCTGLQSNKARRAALNGRAGVCFPAADHNVTLTGRMEVLTDEATKRAMWYEGLKNHFSGPDDRSTACSALRRSGITLDRLAGGAGDL